MRQLSVTLLKCNLLNYQISSLARKNQLLNACFHKKRIPNSQNFVSQLDKVLFAHLLLFFCQSHLIDWKIRENSEFIFHEEIWRATNKYLLESTRFTSLTVCENDTQCFLISVLQFKFSKSGPKKLKKSSSSFDVW